MNILRFLSMKRVNPNLELDSNGHIISKDAIEEREAKAKSFWEKVSDAEKILGRELTDKEAMAAMQRGMWPCTCCNSILSPKDMIAEQEVYFDSLMMGEGERNEIEN